MKNLADKEEIIPSKDFYLSLEDGVLFPLFKLTNPSFKKLGHSSRGYIEHIINNDLALLGYVSSLTSVISSDTGLTYKSRDKINTSIKNLENSVYALSASFRDYSALFNSSDVSQLLKKEEFKSEMFVNVGLILHDINNINLVLSKESVDLNDTSNIIIDTLTSAIQGVNTLEKDLVLMDYESKPLELLSAVSNLCYIRKTSEPNNTQLTDIIDSLKNSKESETVYRSKSIKDNNTNYELKVLGDVVPTYLISVETKTDKGSKFKLYVADEHHITAQKDYSSRLMMEHDKKLVSNFFKEISDETKNEVGQILHDYIRGGLEEKYPLPVNMRFDLASKVRLPEEMITIIYDASQDLCLTRNGKPGTFRYLPNTSPNEVLSFLSSKGVYGDGKNVADKFNARL